MRILLVPGFPGDADEFDAVVTRLGPHRTVAADPPDSGGFTVAGRAAQLAAQLERQGEAVLAVGHSQGGIAALELATRRPDLVRGLVLLDAPVLIPRPLRAILRRVLPLVLGDRTARPVLRRFMTSTFSSAESPEFQAAVLERLDRTPAATIRASVTSTFGYDAAARLTTLSVPCTFVRANIPTDLGQLPATVRSHRIDGAGHWIHVYAPKAVTSIIEEAMADQPA